MQSSATSRVSHAEGEQPAVRREAEIIPLARKRVRPAGREIDRVALAVWSALLGAIAVFWIAIAWQAFGAFG